MIYIPIFKGRQLEQRVMENRNQCFSPKMIPLIEVLKDHFRQTEFATDPISGDYLKRPAGKRMQRYRVTPTEEDRNTLEYYQKLLNGKKAFIDYFRFTTDVYGRGINADAVDLSIRLNQNETLYIKRLSELDKFENFVPVLSIKKDFFPQSCTVTDLIDRLQKGNSQIAVRLDDTAYEQFLSVIASVLRQGDYVMYDIGEQNPSSKEIELEEFNALKTLAVKVVLNSPRKRNVKNGDYENRKNTSLIDNSARNINQIYKDIGGYGDYCGIKDNLPGNQIITRGCALALFYQYNNNQFMAYVNGDSAAGTRGYRTLIPQILSDIQLLDPDGTCDAINRIKELSAQGRPGGWNNWNNFNMSRYITQVYKNI